MNQTEDDRIARLARGELVDTAPSQNLVGPVTEEEQGQLRTHVDNTESYADQISRGFRGTFLYSGYQWADRHLIEADPQFNLQDNWNELKQGVPAQYWTRFEGVRSLTEARQLQEEIKNELNDQQILAHSGAKGVAAYMLGGLVDADLPLTIASGGTYLGEKAVAAAAKAGLADTRVARILEGGAAGMEAAAVVGAGRAITSPTGEWIDIPQYGMNGLVFGSALGTILPKSTAKIEKSADESASKLRQDFNESVADGQAGQKDYTSSAPVDELFNMERYGSGDSVGAASTRTDVKPVGENLTDEGLKIKEEALKFNQQHGLGAIDEFAFPNNVRGRMAEKVYNAIKKTPWASDFDRLMNSPSPIARALVYKLLESPIGIVRNNKSASMLHDLYLNNISHDVNVNYPQAYKNWLQERKINTPTGEAMKTPQLRAMFEKEFHTEMQTRLHDGGSNPASSKAVKEFADFADNASARAVEVLKGRSGETSVRGAESLQERSGYFPQRHDGAKLNRLIKEMTDKGIKNARAVIEDTLAKQYQKLHNWDYKDAMTYSKAVTRRSIANERGIDTNTARMLAEDGEEFTREFMIDSGIPKETVDRLIDALTGKNIEKNKENFLKERVDMDLRTQIPGTENTLMDIMNTDVLTVWTGYSRRVAGAAALARHGIQKTDWKRIVQAIKDDEVGITGAKHTPDEFFDGIYSHFTGGPIAGGQTDWIRRANQLTNLSLLNSLGITQLAETGVNIAAVGIDVFQKTARKEVKELLEGRGNNQAMKELSTWLSPIDGEHMAIREDLMLDQMKAEPGHYSEMGRMLDGALSKGQRLQGWVTGFYAIKQLQQRIAIRGMMHRLGQFYKEGKLMSNERLYDMGLDAKTSEKVGKYFRDGTIEYEADGGIKALHPEKWNPADFEDFVAALHRHTNQVVQKAMKGETSVWMHKDVGALFMHLKNFTILSLQKQLLRHAKLQDTTAMASFLWSLGTAAAVYAAKQGLAGKTDKLDGGDIARGAFALSNLTAVIPSFTDPVAQMLGMEDLKINNYGTMGGGSPLVPIPPMYPTLSRLAMAPLAYKHIASGDYTRSDVYAAQATPLIGNAVGFTYIFNQMKKEADAQRRAEREQKKSVNTQTEQPKVTEPPKKSLTNDTNPDSVINQALKVGGGE